MKKITSEKNIKRTAAFLTAALVMSCSTAFAAPQYMPPQQQQMRPSMNSMRGPQQPAPVMRPAPRPQPVQVVRPIQVVQPVQVVRPAPRPQPVYIQPRHNNNDKEKSFVTGIVLGTVLAALANK